MRSEFLWTSSVRVVSSRQVARDAKPLALVLTRCNDGVLQQMGHHQDSPLNGQISKQSMFNICNICDTIQDIQLFYYFDIYVLVWLEAQLHYSRYQHLFILSFQQRFPARTSLPGRKMRTYNDRITSSFVKRKLERFQSVSAKEERTTDPSSLVPMHATGARVGIAKTIFLFSCSSCFPCDVVWQPRRPSQMRHLGPPLSLFQSPKMLVDNQLSTTIDEEERNA